MPTSERQVKRFACVVENEPKQGKDGTIIKYDSLEEHLKDLKQVLPCDYWAIIHDQDADENGEVKRPHTHIVIEARSRHTCLGVIRAIAETFAVSQERVSVRETRNQIGSIRYLMHMDDYEKTPYPPFDVVTSSPDMLNYSIMTTEQDLTWEALKKAMNTSKNLPQVIEKIGLKNYARYRMVIADFFKEMKKQ